MNISIEQYIKLYYTTRNNSKHDVICANADMVEHNVKLIQAEAADRMEFSIPFRYINSYNVSSCIVPVNGDSDYYHIIDMAMFVYFEMLLNAMNFDLPNMAVFIYRQLRHDLCLSDNDKDRAALYSAKKIYANEHDIASELENFQQKPSAAESREYETMLRFYFLHEYAHYLIANPIRETGNGIAEIVVDVVFKNLKVKNNSEILEKYGIDLQNAELKHYMKEWGENPGFREEICCDIQAILCLLELCGAYSDYYNSEMILDAIMSFLYIQHFIWFAKHIDDPIRLGNMFSFRQCVVEAFAWLLEEQNFADILCQLLKKGNRCFIPSNLSVRPMSWDKQRRFFVWLKDISIAETVKKVQDDSYVFPIFEQPKYCYPPEFLKQHNIPECFSIFEP